MKTHHVMVLLGDLPKLLQSILVEPLSLARNIKVVQVDPKTCADHAETADAVVLSQNSYADMAASLRDIPLLIVVSMDGGAATAYRPDHAPQIFNDFTHLDLRQLIEERPAPPHERPRGFFKRLLCATPKAPRPEQSPLVHQVADHQAPAGATDTVTRELARLARLIVAHRRSSQAMQGPGLALAEMSDSLAASTRDPPARLAKLDDLQALFGLTDAECDLMSLAALVEVDLRAARLVGLLNDHMQHTRPTVGLVADLGGLTGDVVARFAPTGPLMRSGLFVLDGDGPVSTRFVRIHPDVWPLVFGMPRRAPFRLGVADADGIARLILSDAQRQAILDTGDAITKAIRPVRAAVLGDADVGRAQIAKVLAAKLCANVLTISPAQAALPDAPATLNREAVLNDATLILEDSATIDADVLRAILNGTDAPSFLLATRADLGVISRATDHPLIEIDAPKRDLEQRTRMWVAATPEGLDETALRGTAERFDMGGRQIAKALELARSRASGPLSVPHLRAACETLRQTRFDGAAERLECPFDETDIVLAKDTRTELDLAISWARHGAGVFGQNGAGRALHAGGGMACLFSGPPGVGKTMAAQIIARQVDYALYRIDLSKVVDKFIGESEKKLAALFDEAERSRVALFFDEADAVFGKRTPVKESHDRYANITVDYLLQRIEGFDGFAILATNLAGNIDEAFLRRVRVRAEFTAPGPEDRVLIWQKLLPAVDERADDIDIERLARPFELVGGEIRNAIYTAHLLASDDAKPLDMAHCVKGLWREIRKIGRVSDPHHLGPWRHVIAP